MSASDAYAVAASLMNVPMSLAESCCSFSDVAAPYIGLAISPTSVVDQMTRVGASMASPKLTKLELQIMDVLWDRGASSVREIQEAFAENKRPAYTTVQTIVYRLEGKRALRRVKK